MFLTKLSKKKVWLLLVIVAPLQFIHAQVQHALTVEQCQADQKLVLSRLNSNERTLVTYKEGYGWFLEMQDCLSVDPENQARYYNTMSETSAMLNTKVRSYLERQSMESVHGRGRTRQALGSSCSGRQFRTVSWRFSSLPLLEARFSLSPREIFNKHNVAGCPAKLRI